MRWNQRFRPDIDLNGDQHSVRDKCDHCYGLDIDDEVCDFGIAAEGALGVPAEGRLQGFVIDVIAVDGGCLCPVVHLELANEIMDMDLDRVVGQAEAVGDGFVLQPFGEQLENLMFAQRQCIDGLGGGQMRPFAVRQRRLLMAGMAVLCQFFQRLHDAVGVVFAAIEQQPYGSQPDVEFQRERKQALDSPVAEQSVQSLRCTSIAIDHQRDGCIGKAYPAALDAVGKIGDQLRLQEDQADARIGILGIGKKARQRYPDIGECSFQ